MTTHSGLALVAVLLLAQSAPAADPPRVRRPLTTGWRFLRGEAPGAENPGFDDSGWRRLDLPPDWSIEDLPPREKDPLYHVITLVPGDWRFRFGDDRAWRHPTFDDSRWQVVHPPEPWSRYGAVPDEKRTGWYRRRFVVPEGLAEQDVLIELGRIHDTIELYLDGVRVDTGWTDDVYWSNARIVDRVSLLRGPMRNPGEHSVAIRVTGKADGGIVGAVPRPPAASPCDPGRSASGMGAGYSAGGTGWYRTRFAVPARNGGRGVRVVFDGSYDQTIVWLNGVEIGRNVYGYTPFGFDLTPHLRPDGRENVLAVRVRNDGESGRWYAGSGLYRPVSLEITSPLRIALWGVQVTTPEVTAAQATVRVAVEVEDGSRTASERAGRGSQTEGSAGDVRPRVRVRLVDPDGKQAGAAEEAVAAGTNRAVVEVALDAPRHWSPDTPALYRADVDLLAREELADRESVTFGVRALAWNAGQGLLLDGEPVELKGGCVHHDHGPLGSASYPAAEERRVAKLKAAGYNAIRSSHNPPSTAFLDACDRLGMLVLEEAFDVWAEAKTQSDYHRFFKQWWARDVDAMLRRDRNHPSVILWSIGNEIDTSEPAGTDIARALAERVRALDPTRPVTAAANEVSEKTDPFFALLDVAGYNYSPDRYEPDHGRNPERVIVATESFARDSFDYWEKAKRLPYVIGDFIWTAWDYRGESGIGHSIGQPVEDNAYLRPWPAHNAFSGDFDVCGREKPQSLYRQVLWGARAIAVLVEKPGADGTLSEADHWGWREEQPSWTWPRADGQPMVVRVYASGDEVSLALDGKPIDRKRVGKALTTEFRVPYRPGRLTARVFEAGGAKGEATLTAAGPIAGLRLAAERPTIVAARDSIAFVGIEAVDRAGNLIPVETREISVLVSGPGELIALGTGEPTDVGSVQDSRENLWRGQALAIVRSSGTPGRVTVAATVPGLPPARVVLEA